MLAPFAAMESAEDFMEHAIGKKIRDRPDPEEFDEWWINNPDEAEWASCRAAVLAARQCGPVQA